MNYMDKETLVLKTQIELSVVRPKIMKILDAKTFARPKEISELCNCHISYVSHCLRWLKRNDIVYCINNDSKSFRIYKLTEKGRCMVNLLD